MAQQFGPGTASGAVTPTGSGATAITGAGAVAGAGAGEQITPFISQVPGTSVTFPTFHGRAVSWFAVSLIMVAFIAGGLALVIGPTWWLFWASAALAVLGGLLVLALGVFDDWY